MFDNIFSPSPAVWTGLIAGLIALPVLIHLINLMRHRAVKWAAMEFLLRSHKKNRNRIWLKQMLLLFSRIAILLLLLFMLGQVGCNEDRIARLLGGSTTHHYVIIDDSFSMSDRGTEGSATDNVRATLSLIGARAKNRQNQLFTVIRTSMCGASEEAALDTTSAFADMNSQTVDSLFEQRLESVKSRLQPSNFSTGVDNALSTVLSLIKERDNSNAIVYVLSDFRQKDWRNPETTEALLTDIRKQDAAVELINCVTDTRENLAITELVISDSVRVPRTPLMMELTVKNFGEQPASNVQVNLQSLTFPAPSGQTGLGTIDPEPDELPAVFIERIEPGESETRPFAVSFNTAGQHAVAASLGDDSVEIDNYARTIVPVRTSARVLMIDGPDNADADFLSLAISPGGLTGVAPEIRSRDFLRDASPEQLSVFDVIYLLDVDRLDDTAITNLESFADAGGGVAFFAGPNVNLSFYNSQLYRNGEGIFPLSLSSRFDVPELTQERVPDIAAVAHPAFPESVRNPVLDAVQIKSMLTPGETWLQDQVKNTVIAATLRGDESLPLVVQSRFGNGNVLAVLTTAGPSWNNWARNGTYPAVMLLAEDLLASGRYPAKRDLVGVPITVTAPAKDYAPETAIVFPTAENEDTTRSSLTRRMQLDSDTSELYRISLGQSTSDAFDASNDIPGIYDIWLTSNNEPECRRFALNIDTSESDMTRVQPAALLDDLKAASPSFVDWNRFNPEPETESASSLSKAILLLLLLILIAEQILAWSCSYHASGREESHRQSTQTRAGRRRLVA